MEAAWIRRPYGRPVDWRVWTDQPDRAYCASCALGVRPEQVRLLYAVACSELDRLRRSSPHSAVVAM